jgi:effector-binding domain-containing protein
MFNTMLRPLALLILGLFLPFAAMATESAFPATTPGVNELKTLPAGILLKSSGRGGYFDSSNNLFGPLFRYISRHDIAMTTPVEARIEQAAMYFWVAPSQAAKVAGDEGGVVVEHIPERRVASRGAKGGYSQELFEKTRAELLAWLATQPNLEAAGEAYGVYWNAPYVPWFLKRSEVHIPVRAKTASP